MGLLFDAVSVVLEAGGDVGSLPPEKLNNEPSTHVLEEGRRVSDARCREFRSCLPSVGQFEVASPG